ncbi:unnamed protein product [Ixodes persulcatus]
MAYCGFVGKEASKQALTEPMDQKMPLVISIMECVILFYYQSSRVQGKFEHCYMCLFVSRAVKQHFLVISHKITVQRLVFLCLSFKYGTSVYRHL